MATGDGVANNVSMCVFFYLSAGAQEPTKLASAEVSRTEKVIVQQNEIRSRSGDPFVSGGSNPQVNVNGI